MTYLYLDIETTPTQSQEVMDRIAETITPPATMSKPETILAWEKDKKPEAIKEAIAKTSFSGALGHICCIGYAFDDDEPQTVSWPLDSDDEREMLKYFVQFISVDNYKRPVIVGHNVANFDIRFIWQRAMVLGIKMPQWFPRDPKPWGGEVFDTMTAWAGARDTISMDNLCLALGLEGKGDVDGSMVAQMFADGKHEAIAAYCRDDVAKTREIHRKMMVAFGKS